MMIRRTAKRMKDYMINQLGTAFYPAYTFSTHSKERPYEHHTISRQANHGVPALTE